MPHQPLDLDRDPDAVRFHEQRDKIRRQLDGPPASEALQRLTLREGVRLDPLKDKIAENLVALVSQPSDFNRERLLRQECNRHAKKFKEFRFLDDSVRRRPLRAWIEDSVIEVLERRAKGIERPGPKLPLLQDDGTVRIGPLEVCAYGPDEQSDHRHIYDLAVLNLFAILHRLTEEHPRGQEFLFETISCILQAVGVLPEDAKDPGEAVRKRFERANRWPKELKYRPQTPPPVDFCEYELFGLEPRFPALPFALPPTSYAVSTATPASAPTRPQATPDR